MSRALWPMASTATSAANVARAGQQAAEPAVGDVEVLDPAGEADLAAELLELAPERADDQREAVRAEVGAVLVDDRRLAVAVGEDFEDAAGRRGRCSRLVSLPSLNVPAPPFAEEVVALGVERAARVEPADVGDAVLDLAAAFEDQRAVAVQGEQVAGEQPRGARADDHGAMLRGARAPARASRTARPRTARRRARDRAAASRSSSLGQLDLGGVDEVEVVVPARVEALAQDPPAGDLRRARRRAARRASRAGRLRARRVRGGGWRPSGTSDGDETVEDVEVVRHRSTIASAQRHAIGPKQIRVMSSAWAWPAENSRMSWRIARPTASGPPGDSASRLSRRRLSRES